MSVGLKTDITPRQHAASFALLAAQLLLVCNILLIPVLLPFIVHDIDLTTQQSTLLLAVFPVAAMISNIIIGPIIDRFGRLRFFRIGLIVIALCFVASSLSVSGWMLVVLRLATGMAMPMIGATVFALVADNFAPSQLVRMTGRVSAGTSIGSIIVLPAGTLFANVLHWRFVFVCLALFACLVAVLSVLLKEHCDSGRSGTAPSSRRGLLKVPTLQKILAAHFLQSLAFFLVVAMYPTWIIQYSDQSISPLTVFVAGGLGGIVGAFTVARLTNGRSPTTVAAWCMVGLSPVTLLLPPAANGVLFCAAMWGTFSWLRQVMVALIIASGNACCEPARRATFNSLMNVVFQGGSFLGAFGASVIFSLDPSFVTMSVLSACVILQAAAISFRISDAGNPASRPAGSS